MDQNSFKVEGVRVVPHVKDRTIQVDVLVEGGQDITLEFSLPTATRLTDQLVDAEFLERRAEELTPEAQDVLEIGWHASQPPSAAA